MSIKESRKKLENMSQSQLEEKISNSYNSGYEIELAKFILHGKKVDSQHQRSLEIVKKQGRLLMFSTILTVIAMLASVILGYRLEEMKTHSQKPESSAQLSQQKQISMQTQPMKQ